MRSSSGINAEYFNNECHKRHLNLFASRYLDSQTWAKSRPTAADGVPVSGFADLYQVVCNDGHGAGE